MRIKHLLLASAAAAVLGTAGGAAAADVIVPEDVIPSPSDRIEAAHVQGGTDVCAVAGVGYFYIPGTETCLKIGGKVEAGVLYVKTPSDSDTYSGVDAHVDFITRTDSDFGAVGSVARLGLRQPVGSSTNGEIGLELAYVTLGGAYAGYKDSLYNRQFGYGYLFDTDNFSRSNSLTAGYLAEDLGGGFYAGFGVEDANRGQYFAHLDSDSRPDLTARLGLAGQPWGSVDVSALYGTEDGNWSVKGTADVNVLTATQARFTAAYHDEQDANVIFLGAGAQHDVTDQVKAYAGLAYARVDAAPVTTFPASNLFLFGGTDDVYLANAGVSYAIAEGFDVNGELAYGRASGDNNYGGVLRFSRSW